MSYFGIPIRNGLPIGLGSVAPLASGGGSPFSPLSLFAGGAPGAWYDPSDLTTLFQDSAGTTPVTAVEQPVGLMLDKSQGLVLGPELVVNGNFSNGTTGWTVDAGWSIGGGVAIKTAGSANYVKQGTPVVGKWYKVTFDVVSISAGNVFGVAGDISASSFNTTGTKTVYILAISAGFGFGVYGNAAFAGSIDNISVKELPGNHAFQATSASRPVLSARYNLLTKTEDFTNAAWGKTSVTVSSGVSDPDGGTTAFTLTSTADFGNIVQTLFSSGVVDSTIYVRRRTGSGTVGILRADAQNWTTIAVTSTWTKFTVSATAFPAVGSGIRLNTNGDAVDIWHPDLRVANNGTTQPAYQRVNTATDYNTTGFLPYLRFDGVDDSLSTNSISFTSTDKMSVFAGVRKLSDAVMMIVESSASFDTSNGTFALYDFTTGVYYWASRGTITANPLSSALSAPRTNTLTGLGDISGDLATLRVNGAQVSQITSDQGTGNYGNYPLYIGRRGGSSLPLNGQMYSMIIVGKAVTAGELSSTETWVNSKTGAYA